MGMNCSVAHESLKRLLYGFYRGTLVYKPMLDARRGWKGRTENVVLFPYKYTYFSRIQLTEWVFGTDEKSRSFWLGSSEFVCS